MWLPLTCCCLCLGSSSGHPGPDHEEELLITDGFIFKSTKSQNKWTVGKVGITFNSGSVTGLLWSWASLLFGTAWVLTSGMILSQRLHLYSEVVALDNFWAFAGKFCGRSSLFINCIAGSLEHLANFIAWLLPLEWSFKERVGVNLQFQLYIESFCFRGYLLQSLILQRSQLNTFISMYDRIHYK